MSWTEDHDKLTIPEPTLAEMTEKAIRVLREHDNDKGFFLLVEG
jgi:alkaline phosphatase